MPRVKAKSAVASASKSSSKRVAPESPVRQSKRARATARQSYAEADSDSDGAVKTTKKGRGKKKDEDEDDAEVSDFESANDESSSSEPEPDDSDSEEDTEHKTGTLRRTPGKKTTLPSHQKSSAKEKDLWKEGAKLEPGTRLVIKKPKAREPGKTPYTDQTIHPNTMLFLKDLAANNDRQWLKSKAFHHILIDPLLFVMLREDDIVQDNENGVD